MEFTPLRKSQPLPRNIRSFQVLLTIVKKSLNKFDSIKSKLPLIKLYQYEHILSDIVIIQIGVEDGQHF